MPPLEHVLVVNAILFAIGVMGVLTRRNAILILMSVEIMLSAVSLNLVAFAVYGKVEFENFTGIIFAFFLIVVAAAEVALALGIIVRTFPQPRHGQRRRSESSQVVIAQVVVATSDGRPFARMAGVRMACVPTISVRTTGQA